MLSPVDPNDTTPRHQQVYNRLLEQIQAGRWQVGEKIPSELELAADLGVAKLTIHRAVQTLAREGWVSRRVGRGTYVLGRVNKPALRRVVLSFGASAANVLGSDYYGSLYRGIIAGLGPEVELILSPDAFGTNPLPPADGVLVIAPRADAQPGLEALIQSEVPTVLIGAHWPTLPLPTVDSDNQAAAEQACAYLAELGHERLALLYSEPETANVRDRIAGFSAEAKRRGLTLTQHEARASWELTCDEKASLLASVRGGTTAIFAAGYYLSLNVLNTLREAGYSVPADVSVVGFDDPVSAALVYPPLTTLRQPLFEMGKRAAERLLKNPDCAENHYVELLSVSLISRGSAGPPQGN
jgi:GntR family transcriptional regulator, arabinose operon transcriptional repressor